MKKEMYIPIMFMVTVRMELPVAMRPLETTQSENPGMGKLMRIAITETPRVMGSVHIMPPMRASSILLSATLLATGAIVLSIMFWILSNTAMFQLQSL